ncbi:hypothetical protein [Arachnia rubra]|nr:hypothetical protein [Arachnia rubra]
MTHQPTIAVTGVTGRIGGAVATELQDLTPPAEAAGTQSQPGAPA